MGAGGGKYRYIIRELRTRYLLSLERDLYLLETEESLKALSSGVNIDTRFAIMIFTPDDNAFNDSSVSKRYKSLSSDNKYLVLSSRMIYLYLPPALLPRTTNVCQLHEMVETEIMGESKYMINITALAKRLRDCQQQHCPSYRDFRDDDDDGDDKIMMMMNGKWNMMMMMLLEE
ncbi:hypothetical protein TSUD_409310 [Trifolium subterraneum]|uniref:Uncharacterized protein n=1 Tax=Trifolium subterraneum TaxID=3900 RepID=A0A2Z6P3J3_TRISU|nr:hypothetical protein TSUD_409310 [Trifolium subterraneum]